MGYAGWSSGQLEGEIAAGHWEVVPADEKLLFEAPDETKWERAMARRTLRL
jgi:putative transcriptional regulator